jgi:hypothetical protein
MADQQIKLLFPIENRPDFPTVRNKVKPFHCGSLDAILVNGECVHVAEKKLGNSLQICRILDICSLLGLLKQQSKKQPKDWATKWPPNETTMVLVQFLLKRDHESASNVPPLAPPMGRTYIQYPKQVVATNTTQWIPASFIYSEAFVFHVSEVENGAVATAVGMQNAYTVTHKCRLPEKQVTAIAKGFLTFPYMDCHSRRRFDFFI